MVPTSQVSKTSDAQRLADLESDVTMLVIPRGLEHQDLSYVCPGCVDHFRSACYGRPASYTCRRVCCAQEKRRCGSPSATRREAEPLRCKTVQVEGRHPYLVTEAAVLGRSLHVHKLRDENVGGALSGVLRRRSPHLRLLRLRRRAQVRLFRRSAS